MAEQEMEILQGTIRAVVYQNYDNGYAVLRLGVGGGQAVTVVGTIPLPAVGERLMVTGRWSSHASYGRQFEAEFLERLMPETSLEILNYLSSRVIKGIGPKMAARIVEHFGDQTLQIMEREPVRLAEVSGISRDRAKAIGEEFRTQVGMRQLMEFFALHHLPAELAVRTYKLYGESTVELLYDDPYLLMDDGLEAPFEAVDRFAIELGVAGDDPRRVEAGIHGLLTCQHLICITPDRVDLTVMNDKTVRMRALPTRICVRTETGMYHRDRRLVIRILQIIEEQPQLIYEKHSFIYDRTAGERCHISHLTTLLKYTTHDIEHPVEIQPFCNMVRTFDKCLHDTGHAVSCLLAQYIRVRRNFAPS